MLARKPFGTIRSATLTDADALARLFHAADVDLMRLGHADICGWLDHGQAIVLDYGTGSLGAAAHVSFDVDDEVVHAHIEFLVVSPSLAGTGCEERMIGALLAICESCGCVGVPTSRSTSVPTASKAAS
jgi:hypothetical protein